MAWTIAVVVVDGEPAGQADKGAVRGRSHGAARQWRDSRLECLLWSATVFAGAHLAPTPIFYAYVDKYCQVKKDFR